MYTRTCLCMIRVCNFVCHVSCSLSFVKLHLSDTVILPLNASWLWSPVSVVHYTTHIRKKNKCTCSTNTWHWAFWVVSWLKCYIQLYTFPYWNEYMLWVLHTCINTISGEEIQHNTAVVRIWNGRFVCWFDQVHLIRNYIWCQNSLHWMNQTSWANFEHKP